jgi:hypothetical protein
MEGAKLEVNIFFEKKKYRMSRVKISNVETNLPVTIRENQNTIMLLNCNYCIH